MKSDQKREWSPTPFDRSELLGLVLLGICAAPLLYIFLVYPFFVWGLGALRIYFLPAGLVIASLRGLIALHVLGERGRLVFKGPKTWWTRWVAFWHYLGVDIEFDSATWLRRIWEFLNLVIVGAVFLVWAAIMCTFTISFIVGVFVSPEFRGVVLGHLIMSVVLLVTLGPVVWFFIVLFSENSGRPWFK